MRRISSGLYLAVLLCVLSFTTLALAQDKSARGTVTAMTGDSVTVKTADREMKFTVDAKTVLTATGAGTAERKADATGKPGPTLADFVKTGDAVDVSYQEKGTAMHATNIRRISSAGGGSSSGGGTAASGGSSPAPKRQTANGTVDSLTGTTLSISGSAASGGSFKQSFAVDTTTKVVAAGGGTAAAAQGGKVDMAKFVGVGDQVSVDYHEVGTTLHADEVRVRAKK